MSRVWFLISVAIAIGSAVIVAPVPGAEAQPAALAKASPGMWELSGIPRSSGAVRQCVPDVMLLAKVEHRNKSCDQQLVSAGPASTVISYTCSPSDFGRSRIDVITPRSLRIETQGIAGGLPFAYVVQARRVGNCQAAISSNRH